MSGAGYLVLVRARARARAFCTKVHQVSALRGSNDCLSAVSSQKQLGRILLNLAMDVHIKFFFLNMNFFFFGLYRSK